MIAGFKVSGRDSVALKPVVYEAGLSASISSGEFLPFYMSANRFGVMTSSGNLLLSAGISTEMDENERFSYGFGLKLFGGISSPVTYERFYPTGNDWTCHTERPSSVWIQEIYGELKWRSIYLRLGMKEEGSKLLDNRLSSGDLTRSANARPIPQLSGGFIDFRDIPLTKGWLQVEGELAYGKFTDSRWWENHSDFYNSKLASGVWYTYRRLYFRTKPEMPLSVTFGVQSAALFGGETKYYYKGQLVKTDKRGIKFTDFFKILVPVDPGDTEDFAMGNTLGSYDFRADYRLMGGDVISAYFEWPWEDGSGLAKRNGFDGLYGLKFSFAQNKVVPNILIEYLDLTNQSGPIHWAPGDHPGTGLIGQATGADDYYNNAYYQPYANYGLGIGNAMVMSPLYNRDGYMAFIGNRMRGMHLAAEGQISTAMNWEVKAGWRKACGNGYETLLPPRQAWSIAIGGNWMPEKIGGLSINFALSLDHGELPCNSGGFSVGLNYSGNLCFLK